MRFLVVALLATVSAPLLAHEGHGAGSGTVHAMDHMLFTLGAVAVLALGYGVFRFVARREK
ncbi:MAG: hypothetical protein GYB33_21045 [Gammaproteobacteria bacterium]|nr:hypothetical protein [Gammaproteobacteria bacterium]